MVGAETETALSLRMEATFDSSGNASTSRTVGPNQRWTIRLLNTRSDSVTQTRCTVYRGAIGTTQLDFTRTGNGDSSNTTIELRQNETVSVLWEGGTSGSVATLDIEGSVYEKGRRAY